MDDDASIILDGKTLANLRVVDLKLELEKRGLSKSGSKKDLVKRLKQQLEFEKRKSTGDCELKLELDADTEQNEFVQQYLAQQQKIYAEQKEVKRRVELEEIQKSGDEKESCDSTKGDDDKTEDELETEIPPAPSPQECSKTHTEEQSKKETAPNAEEQREKELNTAISSLLSVEQTTKKEEEVSCSEDLATVEVSRSTHDDDREKDLATAVLSSLLVEGKEQEDACQVAEVSSAEQVSESRCDDIESKNAEVPLPSKLEELGSETKSEDTESKVAEEPLSSKSEELGSETKSEDIESKVTEAVKSEDSISRRKGDVESKVAGVPSSSEVRTKNVEFKVPHVAEITLVEKPAEPQTKSGDADSTRSEGVPQDLSVDLSMKSSRIHPEKVDSSSGKVVAEVQTSIESHLPSSEREDDSVHLAGESRLEDATVGEAEKKSKDADVNPCVTEGGKTIAESNEITSSLQPEITAKMDVSSVPYSLAEIQLPESPGKMVKPQSKLGDEPVKTSEVHSNSTNDTVTAKEPGDLNGKNNTSKHDDDPSLKECVISPSKKESATEKTTKVSSEDKRDRSVSDSGSERESSKSRRRKDRRKRHNSSDDDKKSSRRQKDRDGSRERRKSSRREKNRKRSLSSDEDRGSRKHKKSPKKESKRKRDRKHRSSSSDENRSKSFRDSSPKTRKETVSSDEESPKKPVRDSSPKSKTEGERSKTRSKSPRKRSSRKEHVVSDESPSKGKSSVDDFPEKHQQKTDDDQPSRTEESVKTVEEGSPDRERRSRTRSKESPKKQFMTSLKLDEQKVNKDERDIESVHTKDSPSKSESSDDLKVLPEGAKSPKVAMRQIVYLPDDGKQESKTKEAKDEDMECQSEEPRVRSPRSRKRDRKREESASKSKSPVSAPKDTSGTTLKEPDVRSSRKSDESLEEVSPSKKESFKIPVKAPEDTKESSEEASSSVKSSVNESKAKSDLISEESKSSENKAAPKKADVSEGELSSSGESSPLSHKVITISRPSAISSGTVEATMTVIKKEAPKQRLKIKRDNVVVTRIEEPEKVPEEQSKPDVGSKSSKPEDEDSKSSKPDVDSKVPESNEDQKLEPGECPETPTVPYVSSRKITLANRKRTEKPSDEPSGKRSKWGSFSAARNKAKQTVSISTDSLKNWFPDFKLVREPSVTEPVMEEPTSPVKESNDVEMAPVERKENEEPNITITVRKSDPPTEDSKKPLNRVTNEENIVPMPVEDDSATPTNILFVRNLVRPFTLLQLKDLLKETGKTVEDKFWIDKIKSKCFVTYESEEEAVKTRKALNGARWPSSNPKILAVDFATEEDLEYHRSGAVDQPKPRPPSPVPNQQAEEEERRPMEREGRRERTRQPIREWDKDKVLQDSPEKRRQEDRPKDTDKKEKGGQRRVGGVEETPAKLLDDLFQKTKATPCIYWLPLTQEQAKARAESMRVEREHRQQEQENKRPRSTQRGRETETRRSSTRSRSPVTRRR